MPRYMLDTNMCIYLMKNQPDEVARRFAQCYVGDVVMSANPAREQGNLASLVDDIRVLPFDISCGTAYGTIRLATRNGTRKDALDKLIAAHAVALDMTLVTNNEKDFSRYPGLRTENWLKPPPETASGKPKNH